MVASDLHPHPQTDAQSIGPTRRERRTAVRRARVLNVATIGWNTVEGVVAIVAGVAAGSVSLVGFGIDSAIEVSAAVILAWRLHQERKGGCVQAADARAAKAIAVSFAALAIYVAYESLGDLIGGTKPEASTVGVVLAAVSLALMPALVRAKARLAPVLGSVAAKADAAQTNLCALLSAVVLVGVGANWAAGWWWADPIAGIGIAVIAGAEAVRTWRADSLDDTCCARPAGIDERKAAAALAASVLYTLWFALAFGVRTLVAVRRTGDRGFRGVSGAPLSLEWCAGVLFVVALLVGVAASLADLAGMPPLVESRAITAAGLVIALAGIGATFAAQLSMGESWRIGVDDHERTELVTRGAFRLARNPIFSAMAMTAVGLAAMVPNVIAVGGLVALIVAIELQVRGVEELYLRRMHGMAYDRYAAHVGRFLPQIGRLPVA